MDHTYLQLHTVKNGIFYSFVMFAFTYILSVPVNNAAFFFNRWDYTYVDMYAILLY